MQTETKKFAAYQNFIFRVHKTEEVQDEQDAVQKSGNCYRFKMYEQTFAELDGETLKGEPKNHTPFIYTNVDEILSLDDVIAARQAELAAEQGNGLKDEFSRNMSVDVLSGLIADLQAMDPATCYIKEPGQFGEFVRLEKGEKVYNAQGQQLYPAPGQDAAPDVTPAL